MEQRFPYTAVPLDMRPPVKQIVRKTGCKPQRQDEPADQNVYGLFDGASPRKVNML
jgi:hypothetical protein